MNLMSWDNMNMENTNTENTNLKNTNIEDAVIENALIENALIENASMDRTPDLIAAEINLIKRQTERTLLVSAVEIGRRLAEARDLIKYGEWEKWLEESVSYSQRTAERLMRIYKEYGTTEETKLSLTQAFILLGLPKEERSRFIAEMDLENLSTRELQKAVEEWKKALQENARLKQALEDQDAQITGLTTECDALKKQVRGIEESKKKLEEKAYTLQNELASLQKSISYQGLERLRKDLRTSSIKVKANRIAFLHENLIRNLKLLKHELKEIEKNDPETFISYKNKVYRTLETWRKEELWSKPEDAATKRET